MKVEIPMSNGKVYWGEASEEFQYYRVPHDKELKEGGGEPSYIKRVYQGDGYWGGTVRDRATITIPEVYRMLPDQNTPLACDWIHLMWGMNPYLDLEHFELIFDNHWVLFNSTGWPGRYNCLTGADKGKGLPNFHTALIAGGAIVKGEETGENLWLDSLTIDMPVPSVEEVLNNRHWWYYLVQVAPNGNVSYMSLAGTRGKREYIKIPILTEEKAYIPLRWLDKLPFGFLPSSQLWHP